MVRTHRDEPSMSATRKSKNRRPHPHQTGLAAVGPCSNSKAKLRSARGIECREVGAEHEAEEVSTGDAASFESLCSTPPRNMTTRSGLGA